METPSTDLKERIERFVRLHIAGRDLNTSVFPVDLWEGMTAEGLFDLGGQERMSGNYLTLITAGEALVASGGNMGMGLAWLMHEMLFLFYIMGFGTPGRQEHYRDLARGKKILCLAVSEPEKGAHPRHLKTTAELCGDHYIINGTKSYLTNAPIADLFIVIAITEMAGDRKRFTAFLVPKDTPGLHVSSIDLPFLKPCPHGSLQMENCPVPQDNILGAVGQAYEDMVLPFRELEDALMMGPMVGAMVNIMESLAHRAREAGLTEDLAEGFGGLAAHISVARLLAKDAARRLDSDRRGPDFIALNLIFRTLAREFHGGARDIMSRLDCDGRLNDLHNDLYLALHLAENVARLQTVKLGRAVLKET